MSDETIRQLIEAHASMAAWFYHLSAAIHTAAVPVEPPSLELRRAFVTQLGEHFPELGAIAASITEPRPYVPPPAFAPPARQVENEPLVSATPVVATPEVQAPALVDAGTVRFD